MKALVSTSSIVLIGRGPSYVERNGNYSKSKLLRFTVASPYSRRSTYSPLPLAVSTLSGQCWHIEHVWCSMAYQISCTALYCTPESSILSADGTTGALDTWHFPCPISHALWNTQGIVENPILGTWRQRFLLVCVTPI